MDANIKRSIAYIYIYVYNNISGVNNDRKI
jgi:hypothetical protein